MDLSKLKFAPGAKKNRKRIGRGGTHGKTATKGHKGQRSRAGDKQWAWFEGGQMPLQRRIPKRGFTNLNQVIYQIVNVSDLEKLQGVEEINPEVLRQNRMVRKKSSPIKILGNGQLSRKLTVSANAFSKSAVEKIEAAGGRAITL